MRLGRSGDYSTIFWVIPAYYIKSYGVLSWCTINLLLCLGKILGGISGWPYRNGHSIYFSIIL